MSIGAGDSAMRKSVVILLLAFTLGCGKSDSSVATNKPDSVADASDVSNPTTRAVGYVGTAACANCHEEIADQYATHSMGRSAMALDASVALQQIENATFDADGFRYKVTNEDGQWVHHQGRIQADGTEIASMDLVAQHLIGSGNHGQSFLVQRDQYLFMSPITWYPDKQIWHLSPGYEKTNSQFNRPVVDTCLYCHTDQSKAISNTLNKYASPAISAHAIGCERCHGPGQAHAAKQDSETTNIGEDDSIVNPGRLDFARREAICQQCHLSGAARVTKNGKKLSDFRPGEPLESAYTIFTVAEGEDKFVGHVEQMYASKCFTQSESQMGCISCHDPHSLPSEENRISFYRAKCLQCHTEQSCANPLEARRAVTAADSCIDCHMPPLETEIRHAATTDHSIPRESGERISKPVESGPFGPVVAFPSNDQAKPNRRDSAIALVRVVGRHEELFTESQIVAAQQTLERVVKDDPSDYEASEALAELFLSSHNHQKALEVCQKVLALEPRRERTLSIAADICSSTGAFGPAIGYWKTLVETNPWMSKYWYRLAQAYAATGQWPICRQLATEAKLRFPTSIGVRQLLMQSNLALGDKAAAEKEFEEVERFNPKGFASLKDWFERQALGSRP